MNCNVYFVCGKSLLRVQVDTATHKNYRYYRTSTASEEERKTKNKKSKIIASLAN